MSSGPQTQAQEPPANADPGATASPPEAPNEERAVAPVAQASPTVRIDITPVGPQRSAEDLVLEGQQSSASVQAPIQIEGQDPQILVLVAQAETNVQQQNDVRPAEQSSSEQRPQASVQNLVSDTNVVHGGEDPPSGDPLAVENARSTQNTSDTVQATDQSRLEQIIHSLAEAFTACTKFFGNLDCT
ncbi:hypothetical protein HMN09_00301100 [Mycena chlorophos]|uniref:Uncharacterized protein n=1 Tax=Mycena chlorophos TaxID=658473 RepID=A0A8H6WJ82_MYCCL|nr:hypothetical protein HMN09_00301100 [Mycena chlorophos]